MRKATELFGIPKHDAPSPSEIVLQGGNGSGAVANFIRRFSNVLVNNSTDIQYLDDPNQGARFVILTPGVYAITWMDIFTAAQPIGVTVNETETTITLLSMTKYNDIVCIGNTLAANGVGQCVGTIRCNGGEVIRAHTAAFTESGFPQYAQFRIVKVS